MDLKKGARRAAFKGKWKKRARVTPRAEVALTLDNFFRLTPIKSLPTWSTGKDITCSETIKNGEWHEVVVDLYYDSWEVNKYEVPKDFIKGDAINIASGDGENDYDYNSPISYLAGVRGIEVTVDDSPVDFDEEDVDFEAISYSELQQFYLSKLPDGFYRVMETHKDHMQYKFRIINEFDANCLGIEEDLELHYQGEEFEDVFDGEEIAGGIVHEGQLELGGEWTSNDGGSWRDYFFNGKKVK